MRAIRDPLDAAKFALAAINDELEEASTLYTIDVVDFAHVSENFRLVAERQIPL